MRSSWERRGINRQNGVDKNVIKPKQDRLAVSEVNATAQKTGAKLKINDDCLRKSKIRQNGGQLSPTRKITEYNKRNWMVIDVLFTKV